MKTDYFHMDFCAHIPTQTAHSAYIMKTATVCSLGSRFHCSAVFTVHVSVFEPMNAIIHLDGFLPAKHFYGIIYALSNHVGTAIYYY